MTARRASDDEGVIGRAVFEIVGRTLFDVIDADETQPQRRMLYVAYRSLIQAGGISMNVLVAVASKHGSTRQIAEAIAKVLREAELAVDVRAADAVDGLSAYDAVVLGSAIYAGSWRPEAKQFARRYHAELAQLPVWVFSSGPLGDAPAQPHDDPQQLAAPLGDVLVRDHQVFVGKLDTHNLGLAERLITRAVGAPDGDFRDWPTIRAWAGEIAMALSMSVLAGA